MKGASHPGDYVRPAPDGYRFFKFICLGVPIDHHQAVAKAAMEAGWISPDVAAAWCAKAQAAIRLNPEIVPPAGAPVN